MNRPLMFTALSAVLIIGSTSLSIAGDKVRVRVDGLSCAFCAYSLEQNLKKLKEVENVEINLNKGLALLTLKEGESLRDETIRQVVEDSGFTPKEISREQ